MNYTDYINHALYKPGTYHRRYDLDLPNEPETARRIALVMLPFIGLYRPAGFVLSIGMNASRTITHFQNARAAEKEKKWSVCAIEVGKAGLATLSLTTTVYYSTAGLFITTGCDMVQGAASTVHALWEGEYSKAIEEALQTLALSAYLTFMMTGALEAMIAFALIQLAISLYQARGEFAKGRYIEGYAKLGMAIIRMNQVNQYVRQIQMRNPYMEMQRIRAVFLRILRGREAGHLIHHPLSSLKNRIDANDVVLGDGVHFGAHFHGQGGALVKGENLAFRTKTIDGKEVVELDFKVNHAFRGKIDEALKQLQSLNAQEMRDILALSGSHFEKISFESGSLLKDSNMQFGPGAAHKIKVEGLGTILIGSEKGAPTLYDRVVVRLDANQTLFHLHEMLSIIDLDQAISLSTKDDIERLKMGHLFRTFFPREATPFERTDEFFALPLDQLKSKMVEKAPEMKNIFDSFYHRMKEEYLIGGGVRYRIDGLADAAREQGARALTAAIIGAYQDTDLFERVASMIRMGMLSTEVRDSNGFNKHGLDGGFGFDYTSGGADSVFTQLLTEKNCRDKMNFNHLYYNSKVRLLISLDALEMGTYQYHSDSFGNRQYEDKEDRRGGWYKSYKDRDSILEFIRNEQASHYVNGGHEVMLKGRISPSFFTGLIVPDEKTKTDLVNYLRDCGLVQSERILNTSVDRFIRVGTQVTEDLIG